MKFCKYCKQEKPVSEFPKNRSGICKPCKNIIEKQRYYDNKERCLAKKKEYYQNNKEQIAIVTKARHVRLRFGITLEEYEARLLATLICPICEIRPPENLDHNHETGQIRGFLCQRCNSGLGFFNDNLDLLYRAIKYLEDYEFAGMTPVEPLSWASLGAPEEEDEE